MATVIDELITKFSFTVNTPQIKKAKEAVGEFQKATSRAKDVLKGVRGAILQAFGATAIVAATSKLGGFLVGTIRTFEKLRASLKTVTGSTEAAASAFDLIKSFAKETPFDIAQVANAFIKLKALGLDPSEDALRSFGNTAAALGKPLSQVIEAVADAVTGEFERLKEFGIKSRSEGDQVAFTFQGVTTTVGKNAEEIEGFLRSIGDVQFAGAMASQMLTLNGIIANIQGSVTEFALQIGEEGLLDALREVATEIRDMVGGGEDLAKVIGKFLAEGVRTTWKLFKDLANSLRTVSSSDVKSFFKGVIEILELMVEVLRFVVKNWDTLIAILIGSKLARGLSAAQAGLKALGFAASASLGPIGLITQALLVIIPIALKAGNALGDVLAKQAGVARAARRGIVETGVGEALEVGDVGGELGKSLARQRAAASQEQLRLERKREQARAGGASAAEIRAISGEVRSAAARRSQVEANIKVVLKRERGRLAAEKASGVRKEAQAKKAAATQAKDDAQARKDEEQSLRDFFGVGEKKTSKRAKARTKAAIAALRAGETFAEAKKAGKRQGRKGGKAKPAPIIKKEQRDLLKSQGVSDDEIARLEGRLKAKRVREETQKLLREAGEEEAISDAEFLKMLQSAPISRGVRDLALKRKTPTRIPPVISINVQRTVIQQDIDISLPLEGLTGDDIPNFAKNIRETIGQEFERQVLVAIETFRTPVQR